MCGLFFGVDVPADRSCIDVVAHRGPDALAFHQEVVLGRQLSIGHARLRIIDTSTASSQPMMSGRVGETREGRYVIIFNGAIYNYRALRQQLSAQGVEFRTDGDTEVLLQALIHWGEAALPKLSGMFAFVFIDKESGQVLAARDRFGIKPLYVVDAPSGLAIASEIKQLRRYAGRKIDLLSAFDFLEGGLSDHRQQTFFSGISQVRGGHLLRIDLSRPGDRVAPVSWWAHDYAKFRNLSRHEAAEHFQERFDQSVRRHLVADVAVGSCLSGGLDSSSIVATAAPLAGQDFNTFTAEFPGSRVDETAFALAVAQSASTIHHPVRPRETELMDALDDMLFHQDEPFGSSSLFAQWSVFEAASAGGMRVMLDGQGADELLAGYHANYLFAFAQAMRTARPDRLVRLIRGYKSLGHDPRPLYRQAALINLEHGIGRSWVGARRRQSMRERLASHWLGESAFAHIFRSGRDNIIKASLDREGLGTPSDIGTLCHLMVRSISLPSLLRFEDRNSMAHSVEARVPFLDPELAEFCLGLGSRHKIVGGETKSVLRHAMRDRLPQSVAERRDKIGFQTPETEWFTGPLRERMSAGVHATLAAFPDLFDSEQTLKWALPMLDGRAPYSTRLWRLFIFGRWAETSGVSV